VFVPAILAMAAATLADWLLAGAGVVAALITAVAVLVVACPCALGLAIPVAIMADTGRGAQLGLLIRGGESLARIHGLATVVLDKTGTLTVGHPAVVRLLPLDDSDGREALAMAAGAETASEHPLARAVTAAGEDMGLIPAAAPAMSRPWPGCRRTGSRSWPPARSPWSATRCGCAASAPGAGRGRR
jgi:Cu+-exporting ATPase